MLQNIIFILFPWEGETGSDTTKVGWNQVLRRVKLNHNNLTVNSLLQANSQGWNHTGPWCHLGRRVWNWGLTSFGFFFVAVILALRCKEAWPGYRRQWRTSTSTEAWGSSWNRCCRSCHLLGEWRWQLSLEISIFVGMNSILVFDFIFLYRITLDLFSGVLPAETSHWLWSRRCRYCDRTPGDK